MLIVKVEIIFLFVVVHQVIQEIHLVVVDDLIHLNYVIQVHVVLTQIVK